MANFKGFGWRYVSFHLWLSNRVEMAGHEHAIVKASAAQPKYKLLGFFREK